MKISNTERWKLSRQPNSIHASSSLKVTPQKRFRVYLLRSASKCQKPLHDSTRRFLVPLGWKLHLREHNKIFWKLREFTAYRVKSTAVSGKVSEWSGTLSVYESVYEQFKADVTQTMSYCQWGECLQCSWKKCILSRVHWIDSFFGSRLGHPSFLFLRVSDLLSGLYGRTLNCPSAGNPNYGTRNKFDIKRSLWSLAEGCNLKWIAYFWFFPNLSSSLLCYVACTSIMCRTKQCSRQRTLFLLTQTWK